MGQSLNEIKMMEWIKCVNVMCLSMTSNHCNYSLLIVFLIMFLLFSVIAADVGAIDMLIAHICKKIERSFYLRTML